MLAVLTIVAVAVTDLIALAQSRVSTKVLQFIQLGWWVALAVAAAIWVRPEGCLYGFRQAASEKCFGTSGAVGSS